MTGASLAPDECDTLVLTLAAFWRIVLIAVGEINLRDLPGLAALLSLERLESSSNPGRWFPSVLEGPSPISSELYSLPELDGDLLL